MTTRSKLATCLIVALTFAFVQNNKISSDSELLHCRTEMDEGVPIFVNSKPLNKYEVVGTFRVFVWTMKSVNQMVYQCAKQGKKHAEKQGIDFDAIIYPDTLIKFLDADDVD